MQDHPFHCVATKMLIDCQCTKIGLLSENYFDTHVVDLLPGCCSSMTLLSCNCDSVSFWHQKRYGVNLPSGDMMVAVLLDFLN